jgi:hypothetical protein
MIFRNTWINGRKVFDNDPETKKFGSSSTGTLIALILFGLGEESVLLIVRYTGDHSLYIG